jgi:hypothetical protein
MYRILFVLVTIFFSNIHEGFSQICAVSETPDGKLISTKKINLVNTNQYVNDIKAKLELNINIEKNNDFNAFDLKIELISGEKINVCDSIVLIVNNRYSTDNAYRVEMLEQKNKFVSVWTLSLPYSVLLAWVNQSSAYLVFYGNLDINMSLTDGQALQLKNELKQLLAKD